MRCALIATLFALLAGASAAQTVTVRSGEHTGFSRLVFRMPVGTEWRLGRSETGYGLVFATPMTRIDTTRVFDLIPRDRVGELQVAETGDRVDITVPCDCHAMAFLFRPDMLVVDVLDGGASPGSAFEEVLIPEVAQVAPASDPLSQSSPVSGRSQAVLPVLFGRPALAVEPAPSAPQDAPEQDAAPVAPTTQTRVDQANQTLLEQISRAASQGLLDPVVETLPDITVPVAVPDQVAAPEQVSPPADAPAPDPSAHLTLRAGSRIDRDIGALFEDELRRTFEGESCIDDSVLEIANWADLTPFPEQIGTLRGNLLGEFDAISDEAAVALVRFYLHFGFGVEAQRVLNMMPMPDDAPLFAALARIMDTGSDQPDGPFSDQLACDAYAAFWAAMSLEKLPSGARINTHAVLRGFLALPGHLKRHLGPTLSDRFVAADDLKTARLILKDMGRTPGDHKDRLTLSEARLGVAAGETAEAVQDFETVADQNNNAAAAEAVVALINTLTADSKPVEDETAMLAASLAFEYRRDALGPVLAQTEALALAGTGRYAQALARIDRSAFPESLVADTREVIAMRIFNEAGDGDFAALVSGSLHTQAADLSRGTTLAIAQRLAGLHLIEQAQSYFDAHDRSDPSEDESLLRAKLALGQNDPAEALRRLLGLQSEAADLLRAQAFTGLEAHDRAQEIHASQGNAPAAELSRFRAEDWDGLSTVETDTRRALADLLLAPAVPLPGNWAPDDTQEDQRVLDETRSLLQRSSHTRRTLEEALADYPVDRDE